MNVDDVIEVFIEIPRGSRNNEKGPDAKIICVPVDTPGTRGVTDLSDLPRHLLDEIAHFFEVYKTLEPEKESSTRGYEGREAAWREIAAARARVAGG